MSDYLRPGAHALSPRPVPRIWRRILGQWGDTIGLNYDPSHLVWLMIDHQRFVEEFGAHILHVQAKDHQTGVELYAPDRDSNDVRRLGPQRALVIDARGLRYLIEDIRSLDALSRRVLERYL